MTQLVDSDIVQKVGGRGETRRHPLAPVDIIVAIALGALAVAEIAWLFTVIGASLWKASAFNVWFEADTPRVIANWTDIKSSQYRTTVHPLAPALLTLPVQLLIWLGMTPGAASRGLMFAVGATSTSLTYSVLRLLDVSQVAAFVFTLLFLASASFVSWAAVPELNSPAMLTILVALALLVSRRPLGSWFFVLGCVVTMGVTITNWSAGLSATLARTGFRRTLGIAVASIVVVLLLTVAQRLLVPGASLLTPRVMDEYQYTQLASPATPWRPAASMHSLFVTTLAATPVTMEQHYISAVVTNQRANFFDRSPIGIAVAVGWIGLLAAGVHGHWRAAPSRTVAIGLTLMIAAQALLHIVYGDPTFLYAPHFLPILIVIAAGSCFTRLRWATVGLAATIAILAFVDNVEQARRAVSVADQIFSKGGNKIEEGYPPGGALLP